LHIFFPIQESALVKNNKNKKLKLKAKAEVMQKCRRKFCKFEKIQFSAIFHYKNPDKFLGKKSKQKNHDFR
jgi:hypothetical protein